MSSVLSSVEKWTKQNIDAWSVCYCMHYEYFAFIFIQILFRAQDHYHLYLPFEIVKKKLKTKNWNIYIKCHENKHSQNSAGQERMKYVLFILK